jgi:membrane protease YdiL (CAAX protease family)
LPCSNNFPLDNAYHAVISLFILQTERLTKTNGENKMFRRIIIFYGLTWFFLMLLGGVQQATGVVPAEIGLAQWGPGLAALLMLVIFRRDGFKITFFAKDTPHLRFLYAALIPLGVGLVIYLLKFLIPMQSTAVPGIFDNLPLTLLWIPLGAIGEEIGWRGYLHKKLDPHMRGLFSSLLVGILWMPIHVHFLAQGPVFLFFFALMIISYSIVIYALVQDTNFNVLLASIFHLAINLANLLVLDVIYETSFMMISSLVWMVVAAGVVFLKRDLFLSSKE